LEGYPLYSKFGINQPAEASDLDGLQFNSFCKREHEHHFFTLEPASKYNGIHTESIDPEIAITDPFAEDAKIDFTEMFVATCQSCRAFKINMIISGGTQKDKPKYFLRKIGQYPAPEINGTRLPKEISGFMQHESRELYLRGMMNLEMGYGAGAFVYLRKVAENEFKRIVDKLSNPYSTASTKIADAFGEYSRDGHKSKLIEEITHYLPGNLQKHGANTLLVLYDATSISVHELTEGECMKKSKDIDMLLRYVFKKLNEKIKFSAPVILK
jgi:hypothetical protein